MIISCGLFLVMHLSCLPRMTLCFCHGIKATRPLTVTGLSLAPETPLADSELILSLKCFEAGTLRMVQEEQAFFSY